MNSKIIISASILFETGHVEFDFAIYLTEIRSRKPLKKASQNGVEIKINFVMFLPDIYNLDMT